MPRCGSLENVIITEASGFCMKTPNSRKSGASVKLVLMRATLGASITPRIQGLLKLSPALMWTGPTCAGALETSVGRLPLRFTATVVSGSTCTGPGAVVVVRDLGAPVGAPGAV